MGFFDKLFGKREETPQIIRRTPFNLQVQDVINYDLEDYVVVGKMVYDDNSYEWYDYQLDNGTKRIWFGSENDDEVMLAMYELTDMRLTSVPNELTYNGQTFYLDEHGKARIKLADGQVGARTGQIVEYWDFESDNGDYLSVEKWGNEIEVSYGWEVGEHELKFFPRPEE